MDIDTAYGNERKRNTAILGVLDPMHRSLLNNNLRYEQESASDSSEEEHPEMDDSDSEYFTSVSTLISTDTDGNYEQHKYRQNAFDTSVNDIKPNHSILHNGPIDTDNNHLIDDCNRNRSNQLRKSALHSTKINVLATENRCDTNHNHRQTNNNNSKSTGTKELAAIGAQPHFKISTQQQHQQAHRRSSRNSLEGKQNACVADKLKQRNKRSLTKATATTESGACVECTTVHSDSSDINSETNLVIENMRNRESEMYRKISFNNGYYSTTGDSSCGADGDNFIYLASDTNISEASSIHLQPHRTTKSRLSRERKTSATQGVAAAAIATTTEQCNDVRSRKSPKIAITKRKCRSFPLTTDNCHNDRHSNEENLTETTTTTAATAKATSNRTKFVSNDNESKCQTKTHQSSQRKITITIKANTISEQQQQRPTLKCHTNQNQKTIDSYLTNACEISDESDTTVSDYATQRNEKDQICVSSSTQSQSQSQSQEAINGSHSDDNESTLNNENSDSFFSINSDTECRSSEISQYHNCVSFGDFNVENDFNMAKGLGVDNLSKNDENNCETVKKHVRKKEKRVLDMKKATTTPTSPMICIEHEVSENRIVTSRIEVDKAKVKEFKRRQKNRSQRQRKIIDSSFSEEIFRETINRKGSPQKSEPCPEPKPQPEHDISNDPQVINEIVESIKAEERDRNAKNERKATKSSRKMQSDVRKYLDDGCMYNNQLPMSPQHTAIVQRIEKHTLTNVRRSLLRNVAYAITESERQEKLEKKKVSMTELPPIKPPRSFIVSSSSSPLSKESFESSATVPMAEWNRLNQNHNYRMGFVMPTPAQNNVQIQVGEESTVQFGWIRPRSNLDNEDSLSSQFKTANETESYVNSKISKSSQVTDNDFRLHVKENIDSVDGPLNKDFARFSAKLSKNQVVSLSTPIKQVNGSHYVTAPTSVPESPSSILNRATPNADQPKVENICEKCNCRTAKQSPHHLHFGKTSKRIGKAALKQTKTLIGTSKKLLKKPSLKKYMTDKKEEQKFAESKEEAETFHTPMKGDNTVCNNQDTITVQECQKRVHKSLNLTPNTNHYEVQLNPSPNRVPQVSNIQLLNKEVESEQNNDSEMYVTPDEAFDFNRVVDKPHQSHNTNNTNNNNVNNNNIINNGNGTNNQNNNRHTFKRSPSKMVSKLVKSSKKLFGLKGRDERRDSITTESTHYYKANDYDEFDNKVLLMGEMLSEMRKRIENVHSSASNIDDGESESVVNQQAPSAKKCLFRDRTVSTSSGDLLEQESLVEEIARIDLHDEPEPLYAEIEQQKPSLDRTMYRSCIETDEVDSSVKSKPAQLREVYIGEKNKYIMVNNNPKLLYATVNRNSVRGRSLETIQSKNETSEADIESLKLGSSYESLDMSLISDFAAAMQTELDECQLKMNGVFVKASSNDAEENDAASDHQSHSGASIAISDMNSGCSSFYRRNKEIVGNFADASSFDTVGTGSYCESLCRGNDVNSEIKDTITHLEYMPSEMGDSTDSRDLNAAYRTCFTNNDVNSSDSSKFISMGYHHGTDSVESSSPRSSLYCSFSKNESATKKASKKMSPNLKFLTSKLRSSFRMDSKKSTLNKTDRLTNCHPINEHISKASTDDTSSQASSTSSGYNAIDSKRKKLFESISHRIEMMPNSMKNLERFNRMIENIRVQQNMRQSIEQALQMCRSTDEFHNSRELVEAEQLMLMSCLKECSALEELIMLWQNNGIDGVDIRAEHELGIGTLTIKYLEFELTVDSIYDTHFNYFYLCVCTYRDQVEVTMAKERQPNNRITFSNLKMQFYNLTPDFKIRIEVYALRLRKNVRTNAATELTSTASQCSSSRFRLQGKTLLTSSNLSRRRSPSSSHQSPRKLVKSANGGYVYTSHGLISSSIVLCGPSNKLSFDSLKIGYQEQLQFSDSRANGFLNIADSQQKWDRLWCRIDGFSMKFWKGPQDTEQPLLILDLDRCNHRNKTLIVDREICPKPRTFKLDIIQMPLDIDRSERNRHIQSYFISAENLLDLELWLSEIQKIFAIINSWNI